MTEPHQTREGIEEVWLMPVFIAKAGHESELQGALLALQTISRKDPGCLEYTVFVDATTAGKFVLFEGWARAEDLKAHNGESHVKDFLEAVEPLLAVPLSVTPLAPLP